MQKPTFRKPTDERLATGEGREYLEGKDLSKTEDFGRSKTPFINEEVDDFKFMQIDVDYYTENASRLPRKFLSI